MITAVVALMNLTYHYHLSLLLCGDVCILRKLIEIIFTLSSLVEMFTLSKLYLTAVVCVLVARIVTLCFLVKLKIPILLFYLGRSQHTLSNQNERSQVSNTRCFKVALPHL